MKWACLFWKKWAAIINAEDRFFDPLLAKECDSMKLRDKIYVTGHRGLVGSAIIRRLRKEGYSNLVFRNSTDLDLRDQSAVKSFFKREKPDYVFHAAARVGGILANLTRPAEFIYDNLAMQVSVINAAYRQGVKKFLFLGSSCIYPKSAPQPMTEQSLMTSALEPTNEWYAIAKISGVKLCQAYRRQYGFKTISLMPTNLYGPGDNFDLQSAHVLPALIRKIHEAKMAEKKEVEVWGTGTPRREFLYVDDLADACLFLMKNYNSEKIINVGVGKDITIAELAELIKEIVGYKGGIAYNTSKPDGTFQKLLDISNLHSLGWRAKTGLKEGIGMAYQWHLNNIDRQ